MRLRRPRFSTAGIARRCARHPWVVVGIWAVVLALAAVSATGLGSVLTANEMEVTSKPESARGELLLQERLRGPEADTETVLVHSEAYTIGQPQFRQVVERTAAALSGLSGIVASAPTYYQLEAMGMPAAQGLVSTDGHTTIIPVTFAPPSADEGVRMDTFVAEVEAQTSEGFEVLTVGGGSVGRELMDTADSDLLRVEIFGLPLTLVVLILVFGALVAAGVSMALAGVSILVAVGATAIVGQFVDLSFFVINMVTMIGMAVGIDYALFITERYREERHNGVDKMAAITIAGGTASRAVFFSGVTVMLALLGLFLIPITTFRSLGIGAVLVVTAALLAMLTLVPALLSLLGDRIDWPRVQLFRRKKARARAAALEGGVSRGVVTAGTAAGSSGNTADSATDGVYNGFWGRITRRVVARPILSVAIIVVLLMGATVPYFWIERGDSGASGLPEGNVRAAYELLAEDFPAGLVAPVDIVIDGAKGEEVQAGIDRLNAALAQNSVFLPGTEVVWNQSADLALLPTRLMLESTSSEAMAVVTQLREEIIPAAFAGVPAEVLVTGQTAFSVDSERVIDTYTPGVFAFVLGLTFIILLLVFRSLVVPVKAILMNLLSVGATYGILVLVFQTSIGERFFGFQRTGSIESWVPIFLFCILFGLSMDYHVFLLSRIREYFDKSKHNLDSVVMGLKATGKIITGAAAIMVVVFASFATGQLVMMQQMGFGLAVAILIDATLVRIILVPATMALLGRANWYLPRWLRWLPDLRIEGARAEPVPVRVRVEEPMRPRRRR